jgi:hypothetical protein
MDMESYLDLSLENFRRMNRLLDLAASNPDDSDDLMRAVIVMNHAYLEDFLRSLAERFLPLASEEVLNKVPLVGRKGRQDKFQLGALTAHRGKAVQDLIEISVRAYLARSNYNNTVEIATLLTELGFDVDRHNKDFALINELMKRRHEIVHRADRRKTPLGDYSPRSIQPSDLGLWTNALRIFQMSVMAEVTEKSKSLDMLHTGSDVTISDDPDIRVVFSCDGEFVAFQFVAGDRHIDEQRRVSRADAMEIGKRVAETGEYEQLPKELEVLLTPEQVSLFGVRLFTYGKDGK